MTTLRQIVTDGLREAGIIALGSSPEVDEFDEGLRRLNNIIESLFGSELGEPLLTVNYGTSGLVGYALDQDESVDIRGSFIPSNARLVFNIASPTTLYLDPAPMDGARLGVIDNVGNFATYPLTLNGNGRKIESAASVTISTNSANQEWFYRADLGTWTKVLSLGASDQSPLPSAFDDLLVTLLAVRLNPRYGAQTAQETVQVLSRMRKIFKARYRQSTEQPSEDGLLRLTNLPFCRRVFSSTYRFNRGR